ncbi:hypothetical protein V2G26_016091 [Clonostachys chloroleuca]
MLGLIRIEDPSAINRTGHSDQRSMGRAYNTCHSGLHIMRQRKHCRRGTTRSKYKLGSSPVCVPTQATKQMYCDRAALLPVLFILEGNACLMHHHVVQHLLLIRQWSSGASLRSSFSANHTIHRSG